MKAQLTYTRADLKRLQRRAQAITREASAHPNLTRTDSKDAWDEYTLALEIYLKESGKAPSGEKRLTRNERT